MRVAEGPLAKGGRRCYLQQLKSAFRCILLIASENDVRIAFHLAKHILEQTFFPGQGLLDLGVGLDYFFVYC